MTRYPPGRPANPSAPRPAAPGGPGGAPAATIDPVKLLKKYKFVFVGAFAFSIFLGVGSYMLLKRYMPRYQSMVVFQCFPPENNLSEINTASVNSDEMDRFMLTQAATMQSDVVLSDVLNDRRLKDEARTWVQNHLDQHGELDQKSALKSLKSSVSASAVADTYFIQLRASASTPEAAMGIARLTKDAYMNKLDSQTNLNINDKRDTLASQIRGLGEEIEDLSARRARIVHDEELDTIDANRLESAQKLEQVNNKLLDVSQYIEAVSTQIERFEDMLASPTGIQYTDSQRAQAEQTPIVAGLRQQIKQQEAQLLGLQNRGIGSNHRTYRAIVAQIAGLEQKLADERETKLREIFDAEVDSQRRSMAQLRAQESDLLTQQTELRTKLTELTGILAEVSDLERDIQSRMQARSEARAALDSIETKASLNRVGRVAVQQNQSRPNDLAFPKPLVILPLSVLLVCGLTGGAVVLRELLDQRVKSASDVGMIPRTKVIGVIPTASEDPSSPERIELAFGDQPKGVLAESFRNVRTGLLKAMNRAGHRSLVVASGLPGSGATSVITNLALATAATEQRVLIVDANFRRPSMHKVFEVPEGPGLADVLAGEATVEEARQTTPNANLDVLTAGSRELRVYERLGTERMAAVLSEAGSDYDLILIDVAPCIVAGDAYAVANRADASMLVVRAMREKRGMVARLKNELSECRAECLGVLVNAVRSAAGGYMRTNIRTSHGYQNTPEGKASKAEPVQQDS